MFEQNRKEKKKYVRRFNWKQSRKKWASQEGMGLALFEVFLSSIKQKCYILEFSVTVLCIFASFISIEKPNTLWDYIILDSAWRSIYNCIDMHNWTNENFVPGIIDGQSDAVFRFIANHLAWVWLWKVCAWMWANDMTYFVDDIAPISIWNNPKNNSENIMDHCVVLNMGGFPSSKQQLFCLNLLLYQLIVDAVEGIRSNVFVLQIFKYQESQLSHKHIMSSYSIQAKIHLWLD